MLSALHFYQENLTWLLHASSTTGQQFAVCAEKNLKPRATIPKLAVCAVESDSSARIQLGSSRAIERNSLKQQGALKMIVKLKTPICVTRRDGCKGEIRVKYWDGFKWIFDVGWPDGRRLYTENVFHSAVAHGEMSVALRA
jgi:hypothetical protein